MRFTLKNGNLCEETCNNLGAICETCRFPEDWQFPKRFCEKYGETTI